MVWISQRIEDLFMNLELVNLRNEEMYLLHLFDILIFGSKDVTVISQNWYQ